MRPNNMESYDCVVPLVSYTQISAYAELMSWARFILARGSRVRV